MSCNDYKIWLKRTAERPALRHAMLGARDAETAARR